MRNILLTATLTIAISGTAVAGSPDVYERSHESGVSVYRGHVPAPDYRAILAERARQQAIAARHAEMAARAAERTRRLDLLERQTEALEDIATAVEDLQGYGGGYVFGYDPLFGFTGGFNGLFFDSVGPGGRRGFPARTRVNLNAPGALRPAVIRGPLQRGNVRY